MAAEEGRRRGRGRSRRRSPAPQGKVRRGLPDPGAGSHRAAEARGSRWRPAASGGQRRLPGLAATPGSGPHPPDAPHGGADKAGEALGRPGGCALWRGGNTACGGGGWAPAGLFGTAGGMGSSSSRAAPGLAGCPAWPEPGWRRVGRVGAVSSPGMGAEAGHRFGGGAAVEQVSGERTFGSCTRSKPRSGWPLASPAHRLLEEPTVVAGSRLGFT